jgi:hypothetical protein
MTRKYFVFILVFAGAVALPAFAYSDRIDASAKEIYEAAKIAFSKEGIYKDSPEKNSLTTKWIYSRIRRSRKRKFVPLQLMENVDLRYQMKVEVQDGKNYSDVSVVGRFEEKATDGAPQLPWKRSYSSKELYFKEREYFTKILDALETQKKSAMPPSAQIS